MADAFETFTKFVQSLPGQLAAGAAWGGTVWKFFERVEAVLSDQTRRQVGYWLVRTKTTSVTGLWPDGVAVLFNRFFGGRQASFKCFWRCSAASLAFALPWLYLARLHVPWYPELLRNLILIGLIAFILPSYFALGNARWLLQRLSDPRSNARLKAVYFCISPLVSLYAVVAAYVLLELLGREIQWVNVDWFITQADPTLQYHKSAFLFVLPPVLFAPIWIWLYAISGFLLRAARHFDIGLDWFNRHF